MLRDRVAQVMPHWSPQVPGFGYVLGMYAFGLEETNLYGRAEDTGRRALEIERRDPWAVHAVTHVMEMQGCIQEGIGWLEGRVADWAPGNGFAFHNWWHLALYQLDLGQYDRALEIYDRSIRPRTSQVAYENVDASALLWRLHLRGVDVGERWQSVADGWEAAAEDAFYAFNDLHALMAFVGAGRMTLAARTLAAMERRAAEGGTNAMMTAVVGLPLARAIIDFDRGAYHDALERLLEVRTIAHRFGGSHAQRDLVHLTAVEAALRAGRAALARALAAERTELKPSSPFDWSLTARALAAAGEEGGAARARELADLRLRAQRQREASVVRATV